MAVPTVISAKGVTCGGFNRRVVSFCMAGTTLRDIRMCFETCPLSDCAHCFQKMSCIFRGKRSTLATSIVILCGRPSTFDVSRGSLLIVRAGRLPRNIDFEVLRKTRRKILILKLQIVKNIKVPHGMLVLMLQHVLS